MKILIINPPRIPSYFNAAHHLCVFILGSYLRSNNLAEQVKCIDAAALNYNWKEIGDLLLQNNFDLIAVASDFDSIEGVERFIFYAHEILPKAKLIAFGRLAQQVPGIFQKLGFDAVAFSGDYEDSVGSFINYLNLKDALPNGCYVRNKDEWVVGGPGAFLDSKDWELPNVEEIPYEAYSRLYASDQNKFAGIPNCEELVVPIARGCPVNCDFCDVPVLQGRRERRITTDRALNYIVEALKIRKFDYVSMFAPTFTLRKNWVIEFCNKKILRNLKIPWKCSTTLYHLDEELLSVMSKSGCKRVSVGLESLSSEALGLLPSIKQRHPEQLWKVNEWCKSLGIELNCFIILGLPGESSEQARYGISLLRENGIRVRPTIYTPFYDLTSDMSTQEVSRFNRQILVDCNLSSEDKSSIYRMFFEKGASTNLGDAIKLSSYLATGS